jgi:hypothetical protein
MPYGEELFHQDTYRLMKSFKRYILEQRDPTNEVLIHKDKMIVGVEHGSPYKTNNEQLISQLRTHGANHGFYYEGKPGIDILQPSLGLHDVKQYRGGFDEVRDEQIRKSQNIQPHHLSILFSNVNANWNHGIGEHFKSGSVFDGIHSWARSHFGDFVTPEHISGMLTAASENTGNNFLDMAKTSPASSGKKFLGKIEKIAWPSNWATKKRETGPEKLVDMETRERDSHLLNNMGPGVYIIGGGHLDSIRKQLPNS